MALESEINKDHIINYRKRFFMTGLQCSLYGGCRRIPVFKQVVGKTEAPFAETTYRSAFFMGYLLVAFSLLSVGLAQGWEVVSQLTLTYIFLGFVVSMLLRGCEEITRITVELIEGTSSTPEIQQAYHTLLNSTNRRPARLIHWVCVVAMFIITFQLTTLFVPSVYKPPYPGTIFAISIALVCAWLTSAAVDSILGAVVFARNLHKILPRSMPYYVADSPSIRLTDRLYNVALRDQALVTLALVAAILFSRPTDLTFLIAALLGVGSIVYLAVMWILKRMTIKPYITVLQEKVYADLKDLHGQVEKLPGVSEGQDYQRISQLLHLYEVKKHDASYLERTQNLPQTILLLLPTLLLGLNDVQDLITSQYESVKAISDSIIQFFIGLSGS